RGSSGAWRQHQFNRELVSGFVGASPVSRKLIENHIAGLEAATLDNYHDHRNWLNNHRFYVNSEQCARINKTVERLDALPKEVGLIYLGTERFETHPDMEESYLTD
ncbi:hypothetical protein, partial [Pseudomonas sp. DP16D-R1]|uniref:hypothetical protein n=2 Tax=Pseudomonas sp. DP16D-R1 TaxID=2075551 RepID=UPI002113F7A6